MRGAARAIAPIVLATAMASFSCASGVREDSGGRRPGRFDRVDDWITLADFRNVTTVAVGGRVAYFGTTEGLLRLRTLGDRWLSPLSEADGLPDRRVTALAVDPSGDDAWIGTARGLVRLVEFTGEVEPTWGPPPVPVELLRVDPRDGSVYARLAGAWWIGSRGSPVMSRIAARPSLRGLSGPVPADGLRPEDVPWNDPLYVRSALASGVVRLTEVDRDPRGDWYAGTWGDHARRWGAGSGGWEPLRYGLAGPSGGPVVRTSDGYWFFPRSEIVGATRGAGEAPSAAVHADPALERWRYAVAGREAGLPRVDARDAVARGDTIWVATPAGLVRGVGGRWSEIRWPGRRRGIEPTALALVGATLWVGTERGVVAWDRSGGRTGEPLLRGRVHALVPDGERGVYAATDRGLFEIRPASGVTARFAIDRVPTRGTGVRSVARVGSRLVAATDADVEILERTGETWERSRVGAGRVPGRPLVVAAAAGGVWIGTTTGLVRWRLETDEWRSYRPADGLAGAPVHHLLAEEGVVWASTPAGVSRFDWGRADP